jgi:hypothetical protein
MAGSAEGDGLSTYGFGCPLLDTILLIRQLVFLIAKVLQIRGTWYLKCS